MAAVRYLIVSDLHLTDIEDHEDGWRPYKATRYVFDREFADLLEHALQTCPAEAAPVLLMNGDIVDFDLVTAVPEDPPWPVSHNERLRCLDPTPPKSAWKMERVLHDHPGWIEALAGWVLRGGRIVWVMGNHDRELHFVEVQDVFLAALRGAVTAQGGAIATGAVRFEPWFYLDPGRLFAEHGNQYDYYSSFKHVLCPIVEANDGPELALPMGNLSGRYLLPSMGYFNPHATDFILNMFAYLTHWLRHYAFTRRSLVMSWFVGSILVMARLLRVKGLQLRPPECHAERMDEQARRAGVSRATVDALEQLHIPPITTRFYRIVREFWIDRLAMMILMTGGTVVLAFLPVPTWVKVMVPLAVFPLTYFIYEELVHGEDIFSLDKHMPGYAREIARRVPVRIVAFGHTHRPRLVPLERGVSFLDSGTWAPIARATGEPAPGYWNYALVDFEGEKLAMDFGSWRDTQPRPAETPVTESAPAHAERAA